MAAINHARDIPWVVKEWEYLGKIGIGGGSADFNTSIVFELSSFCARQSAKLRGELLQEGKACCSRPQAGEERDGGARGKKIIG